MRFALILAATLLTLLAPARAQSLFVESRFPLVGVLFDEQAVQVNVSNMGSPEDAPAPCNVLVEFFLFDPMTLVGDSFKRTKFTLANGQTAVADVGLTKPAVLIKGKVPTSARVLVQQTSRRVPSCRASLEVVEVNPPEPEIPMMLNGLVRIPGRTTVAIGDQHRPQAEARFPALTLAAGQAIRINAINIGDPHVTPCPVDVDVSDAAGTTVAQHRAALAPGMATSLDVFVSNPEERIQLRAAGERAQDRIVKESCGTFLFSVEIYDLATGKTTLIMGDPEL
jgi:hypothetical protein